MPLTSINKVQKTFPSIFAEKMSQNARRRAQSYTQYRNHKQAIDDSNTGDIALGPLDNDAEISEMCDSDGDVCANSLGHSHSRLTPEISSLRPFVATPKSTTSDSGSESNTTTPRPSSSPSPRGINISESPRPQTTARFVPASRGISPRLPRHSPHTTNSLDIVDLWEEEGESDSIDGNTDFDHIEGIMIDPLKTFDFSDLRRSKSPVACKRNKISNDNNNKPKQEVIDRRKSPRGKSPREKQQSTARARAARRLKQLFPNPAVTKPRLHIAKPHTNNTPGVHNNKDKDSPSKLSTVETPISRFPYAKNQDHPQQTFSSTNNTTNNENKDAFTVNTQVSNTTTSATNNKQRLLPQRGSRLAAKFPVINMPHQDESNISNSKNSVQKQSTTKAKPDKLLQVKKAGGGVLKSEYSLRTKDSVNGKLSASKIDKAVTISKCSDIIGSVLIKDNELSLNSRVKEQKLYNPAIYQGSHNKNISQTPPKEMSELEKLRRLRSAFNGLTPTPPNSDHTSDTSKMMKNKKTMDYSPNSTGDPNSTGESDKSNKDSSPNSTFADSRKVKFNSFVTVREDEVNSLDYLKHSNDSAQMFKNRYLRNVSSSGTSDNINKTGYNTDSNMIQTMTM